MKRDVREAMSAGEPEVALDAGGVTFELVRIPPGEFDMGSPEAEQGHLLDESPVRRIRITKAFYLGRFPVTQIQYTTLIGQNPSNFRGDSLAMDQLVLPYALDLCRTISDVSGVRVGLPTEAQWEYACRAGTTTRFYTGDTDADLDRAGWYRDNAGGAVHPVGLKAPNAFGLYDMHGNVWELCASHVGDYAKIGSDDGAGPIGRKLGAMRGGGYTHGADYARSASRLVSDNAFGGTGVRIVVS